ncbi:Pre-mRNA-splicing factor syf2 [Penicillium cinerascens]|uniref:Pre-mRNA-splicing factor SYF2 n=1 Tax=Penicillium cinerascens TaxID=70096 RepID=A0A9W9NAP0_9EURO|nr:Pre-mRNA-splicing factor syf2 [Penicillium cinerascens]KAJ5216343.1 Pre-mRNA-splicing factor syf2 [Penicillium cinerascens]
MVTTRKQELSAEESSNIEKHEQAETATNEAPFSSEPNEEKKDDDAAGKARDRQARFKALQARAKSATERNLKETAAETQRLSTDPGLVNSLSRKHAFASHNLLKADTEAAGEDFERKRAWDWTIDESEKWDRRMEKKQRHRDNVAFQDYTQDALKVYKRQMRELPPNLEAYEKEKLAAIEKAAANGDLEIVETEDGEMVAIDKNGSFYSTADSVGFTDNKPNRAAVDRLVGDIQKAEEVRLKKRKERRGNEEEDVTYINEKNKQFNQKLARFYNKYTSEIRDSFERGTMI